MSNVKIFYLGWNGEVKLADFGLSARIARPNHDRLAQPSGWLLK